MQTIKMIYSHLVVFFLIFYFSSLCYTITSTYNIQHPLNIGLRDVFWEIETTRNRNVGYGGLHFMCPSDLTTKISFSFRIIKCTDDEYFSHFYMICINCRSFDMHSIWKSWVHLHVAFEVWYEFVDKWVDKSARKW